MYKIFIDPMRQQQTYVIKIDSGMFIPLDESNVDYQEYLSWLSQGNIPEPADDISE